MLYAILPSTPNIFCINLCSFIFLAFISFDDLIAFIGSIRLASIAGITLDKSINTKSIVVDIKKNHEGNFAILDGGMNHLVYYGQMMAMKHPMVTVFPNKKDNPDDWNLCGALCTVNDLIVKKISVNNLEVGDIFIFHNTGAYAMTEGISLFLSRDLPKVVLVEKNKYKIVRDNIPTYELNMPNGGEING